MAKIEVGSKTAQVDLRQVQAGAADSGIVKKLDTIIEEAVTAGATSIHLEPGAQGLTIRIRTKGVLTPVEMDIPPGVVSNVINRVKVLSAMDITRSKIPQNGFFKLVIGERKIELHASVLPTIYGEAAVMRVQYKQSATLHLEQLGMSPKVLAGFQKALARGSGFFLITGPPGSGKRTTAYAAVLATMTPDKLAFGIDPLLKYEIPGMLQGTVEEKSEYTMAEAIKGMLRQEPDVAYVGDIGSVDDARAAIQGAFAKRTLLCRMTATDSVNAVQNLVDMGIQPFLVAASLAVVVNQRLLRRLCGKCRQPFTADEELQKQLGVRLREGTQFFRAGGCPECGGTGYNGHFAIFELFAPSEELNKMVVARESVQAIRQRAVTEGMVPLKMDGIGKAMQGLVTLEDVLNSL